MNNRQRPKPRGYKDEEKSAAPLEPRDGARGTVVFDRCRCVKATTKAQLVRFANGKEHWIPKSQVHADSEVYRDGDEGKLVVMRWFAEREGWV